MGPETNVSVAAVAGTYLIPPCQSGQKLDIPKSKDNDLSVALRIEHDQFSYFIGGDLTGGGNGTRRMEQQVANFIGDVDILKVNHHGSETSSSEEFLRHLSPEVAIISIGNGGVNLRYKLPRQSVLDRIAALNPEPLIFLTNRGEGGVLENSYIEDRHIIVRTDGASYTVNGKILCVDERLRPNPERRRRRNQPYQEFVCN